MDHRADLLCALEPCLLLGLLDSLHVHAPASASHWTQQMLLQGLCVPILILVQGIQHNFLLTQEGTVWAFEIHGTSTSWWKLLFTL